MRLDRVSGDQAIKAVLRDNVPLSKYVTSTLPCSPRHFDACTKICAKRSQTTTTTTALSPRRVGWRWRDILDTADLHARTSQSAERRLSTWTWRLGAVAWEQLAITLPWTLVRRTSNIPPVALIFTCSAVIPNSLHRAATSCAANIAAYGEDSSRSALTFMPPVTRLMVSRPLESPRLAYEPFLPSQVVWSMWYSA